MNIKKINTLILSSVIISIFTLTGCNQRYSTGTNTEDEKYININNDLETWDEFSIKIEECQNEFMIYAIPLLDGLMSYEEVIDNLNMMIPKGRVLSTEMNILKNSISSDLGKEAIHTLSTTIEKICDSGEEIQTSLLSNNYEELDNAVEKYLISFLPILKKTLNEQIGIANSEIRNQDQEIEKSVDYDLTEDIKIVKENYREILKNKNTELNKIDISPISDYLEKNFRQSSIISLLNYEEETIRLKANYIGNGYSTHLPRSIMSAVKKIESMGYPIKTLEVEFYAKTLRTGSYDSVLLYKNSNINNINIYVDDLGYIKTESFYKNAELEILNQKLLDESPDIQSLYDLYKLYN